MADETPVKPQSNLTKNAWRIVLLITILIPINLAIYTAVKRYTQTGTTSESAQKPAASSDDILKLENAVKTSPSYNNLLNLGVAYYNAQRFQDAINVWQQALQYNPNSELAYCNMGAAYGCLHNWTQQKAYCEKALSINPNFTLAKNNLKWAMDELAKAGTPATGLAATAPAGNDFNSLVNQGLAYYNQKDYTNAISTWQKALALNPNSEIVYSNMGAAYGCLGQWKEQVACCQKALAINPNYALARNNLAWGQSELKKHGLAQ